MSEQENIYSNAGFGAVAPRGKRAAVVIVDFSYGFTDTKYPTAADMSVQVKATRKLTDFARSVGIPVIYTTIAYQPWEIETLPWLKVSTGMAALKVGTRLVEIDQATGVQQTDTVLVKQGASSFFGTNLAAFLTGARVDTLVVTGATTSGCVRATVVDAVQSGFNVLVPHDCCADRALAPHQASLYDMAQKYANVTDSADVLAWLQEVSD